MFSWWSSSDKDGVATEESGGSNDNKLPDVNNASSADTSEATVEAKDASETAKDLAKNVGSFLYSFASVASQTAVKVKDTVKETVEGKALLGDFNREQEKFLNEKHSKSKETGVPPWVGYHEEESMKSQILALSSDERNFLRDPPPGVQFVYDYETMFPVALATLEEDPELKNMRFNLVPKKIKENMFWRNYFYRVSLIKQSSQLTTLAQSSNGENGKASESKTSQKPQSDNNKAGENNTKRKELPGKSTSSNDNTNDDIADIALSSSPTNEEFISDAFDGAQELSKEDLEQIGVKRSTEKSGEVKQTTTKAAAVTTTAAESSGTTMSKSSQSNAGKTGTVEKSTSEIPDWEKELQEELKEYDVVVEEDGVIDDDDDDDDGSWEKEIEDMLEAEEQ